MECYLNMKTWNCKEYSEREFADNLWPEVKRKFDKVKAKDVHIISINVQSLNKGTSDKFKGKQEACGAWFYQFKIQVYYEQVVHPNNEVQLFANVFKKKIENKDYIPFKAEDKQKGIFHLHFSGVARKAGEISLD